MITQPAPVKPDTDLQPPRLPAGTGTDKVLVIGIDGLRWDRVADAQAPTLQRLIRSGLFAPSMLDVSSGAETLSGPGWSTLATGVWPDEHGVRDNTFAGSRYDRYPDFLTRLSRADPARSTYAAFDWAPLAAEGTFGPQVHGRVVLDGEENGFLTEDARLVGVSARVLREQDPDAAFIYLGAVDVAGHGAGAASSLYIETISHVDGFVRCLLDAVEERPSYRDERWLILIATDHGHRDEGGHGGHSADERRTFVLAAGAGVVCGVHRDGGLVDVAVTALDHLGVRIDSSWGLKGRSLLR